MIEQIMYFMLGLLTAALVTIALLPALWRRAVRLTRQELEATLPLSPEEIAAEKDQIRAGHAVELRRIETGREAAEAAVQAVRAESGQRLIDIHARDATIATHLETIAARDQTVSQLEERIAGLEDDVATLERERDNLITNHTALRLTNQALDQQAGTNRQLAEQRQARIAELESAGETLAERLAEAQAEATRHRDDAQMKGDELRLAARKLREAASHIATAERRLTAAETTLADQQRGIEELQAERLRLIDEAGQRGRERDFEHIERQGLAAEIERLNRKLADSAHSLEAARTHAIEQQRDMAGLIDRLRQDRRAVEQELAGLRLKVAEQPAITVPDEGAEADGPPAFPPEVLARTDNPRPSRRVRKPENLL